jgi:hypothetical protein
MAKLQRFVITGLFGVALLGATTAEAAKPNKKTKPAPETYSSIDDGSLLLPAPRGLVPAVSVTSNKAQTQTPTKEPSFDPVPQDQAELIARRLQLIDQLIRRHGRAYDYRTLTVRQLESILARLEADSTSDDTTRSEPEA